jgi:hypothetical protein
LRIFLGFITTTLVGILNKLKSDLIAKPKKVENQKIIGVNILNKIFKLLTTIRDDEAYKNLKNNEEIYSMAYVVMTMLAVCCREIPGMAETVGSGLKQIFKLIIVVYYICYFFARHILIFFVMIFFFLLYRNVELFK